MIWIFHVHLQIPQCIWIIFPGDPRFCNMPILHNLGLAWTFSCCYCMECKCWEAMGKHCIYEWPVALSCFCIIMHLQPPLSEGAKSPPSRRGVPPRGRNAINHNFAANQEDLPEASRLLSRWRFMGNALKVGLVITLQDVWLFMDSHTPPDLFTPANQVPFHHVNFILAADLHGSEEI